MPTKQQSYITRTELREELVELEDRLSKKIIDDLSGVIQQFAVQIDDRFTQVEERFDRLVVSLDRLTNTIDGFVKRLDDIETDNSARDAQHERLLVWAKKVSAKTGIPIEY